MKAYEKYQLQWMIEHGYSLKDLIERLGEIAYEELTNDGSVSFDKIIDEAFEVFEQEQGFAGGEIWSCEDEFNGIDGVSYQD